MLTPTRVAQLIDNDKDILKLKFWGIPIWQVCRTNFIQVAKDVYFCILLPFTFACYLLIQALGCSRYGVKNDSCSGFVLNDVFYVEK